MKSTITFIMSLGLFVFAWFLPVYVLLKAFFYIKNITQVSDWGKYRRFLNIYLLVLIVAGFIWLLLKRSGVID